MAQQLDKFFLIEGYCKGHPIYHDNEFFASSLDNLRIVVRMNPSTSVLRQYEVVKVETQSVLKLSKTKSN